MLRIAVDAMGGDFAPASAVEGAFRAAVEDGTSILLVGDQERLGRELAELAGHGDPGSRIEVVHAEEVVGMDEPAVTPLRRKRRSSISICAQLVRDGTAQAMVSAGNTGAAMAVAMVTIGTIPGVDRPALAAIIPRREGRTVLLDVGANVSTKAHHLRQFAVMGHFYAQEVLGVSSPRIGLMSVGEEEGKGTEQTREVNKVLQGTGLEFVGNVEGGDVFNGSVDVVVCDGFVGNVLLKAGEALARMIADTLEAELKASLRTKIGALLMLPALARLRRRSDPNEYGAAPLLGIEGGCFIGHGRSSARGVHSAVRRAVEFCAAEVHVKIRDRVAIMHEQEEKVLGEARGDFR